MGNTPAPGVPQSMPVPPNVVTVPNSPPDSGPGPGETAVVGAGAAVAAGVGYRFDPETIQPVIDRIWGLINGPLMEAQNKANDLVGIDPPGLEVASEGFVANANAHGDSYANYLAATIDGLTAYVTKLEETRDGYVAQEGSAAQAFKGQDT